MIENFDKSEFEFTSCFKERTKADYGLKYDIIPISNTIDTSNSSMYNAQITSSSFFNVTAVNLALALSSCTSLKYLVRSDFLANLKTTEHDTFSTIKYLWQWFDCM